jgi:uncharacterized membrane protein
MPDFGFVKNGVFIAVIAHGLIGISLIWDKVLLKNPGTRNLYSYVFWLGSLSVLGVLLVPFGYRGAPIGLLAAAFGAGVIHLTAVFFYYAALKLGEASETLAIMGGFSPAATMAISFALLSHPLKGKELTGFALMTAGGFVMFFSEGLQLRKLLPPVLLASGLLGFVNVVAKLIYNHTNFVTAYVWFTIGTFAGAMALLIPPSWRKQILSETSKDNPRNRFWYFVNRFMAGVGSFLVVYAISLAHPALVDAISGERYVIIFLGAYLLTRTRPNLLKEDFRGWQLVTKTAATLLVATGLVMAALSGNKAGGGSPTALERSLPARQWQAEPARAGLGKDGKFSAASMRAVVGRLTSYFVRPERPQAEIARENATTHPGRKAVDCRLGCTAFLER